MTSNINLEKFSWAIKDVKHENAFKAIMDVITYKRLPSLVIDKTLGSGDAIRKWHVVQEINIIVVASSINRGFNLQEKDTRHNQSTSEIICTRFLGDQILCRQIK